MPSIRITNLVLTADYTLYFLCNVQGIQSIYSRNSNISILTCCSEHSQNHLFLTDWRVKTSSHFAVSFGNTNYLPSFFHPPLIFRKITVISLTISVLGIYNSVYEYNPADWQSTSTERLACQR